MGRRILITTPENVHLEYPLAGLGSRFLALAVDTLIQSAVLLVLVAVVIFAAVAAEMTLEDSSGWVVGVAILLAFLVMNGYFILFEALWSGQTPGKRVFGLRVIREGGHPLDFRGSFLRNVVRLVDFLPGLYGVGILFVFFHPQYRRVGDLAAGTLVVRERDTVRTAAPAWQQAGTAEPVALPLSALSREHLELAEAFLRRRAELDPRTRAEMASEIAWRLRAAMALDPAETWAPEALIEEVVRGRAVQAGL